jgi:hypothetical protein
MTEIGLYKIQGDTRDGQAQKQFLMNATAVVAVSAETD